MGHIKYGHKESFELDINFMPINQNLKIYLTMLLGAEENTLRVRINPIVFK